MMNERQKRLILGLCGLGAWDAILFAWLYLEKTLYLPPCPLCMMQRVAFGIAGLFMILEALCWPEKPLWRMLLLLGKYSGIFFGIGLAARHLYIQGLPPEAQPACGFDFWGTLDHNGFWGGLWQSMQGTGDCAVVDKFLGLAIPLWALIGFIGLLLIATVCGNPKYRAPHRRHH